MNQLTYDVIVVGASNAGGMAAAAAAEKGAKVLVIDKMKSAGYLYRYTIASLHSKAQQKAGVAIDQNELVNFLSTFAQGHVDERLLNLWAEHSSEAVDWLDDQVLKPHGAYMQSTPDAHYETERNRAFATGNEVTAADGKYWAMGYGNWVIEKAQSLGVEFAWQTKLEQLVVNNGRVTGVLARSTATNEQLALTATKGVILCTGGYGTNTALMQQWNPLGLKTNVYSDGQRDDGSGLVAALQIGAAKDEEPASIVFNRGAVPAGTNTEDFYAVDLTPPDDPGYLWLGSYPMLKVNLKGERFFNESAPYQYQPNAAAQQPGYLSAMIWTEATMTDQALAQYHTLGCSRLGFPGIFNGDEARAEVQQRVKEGLVKKADSVADLAKQLQIPADSLVATVARYNQEVAGGVDQDFGKEPSRLEPVNEAPYYGAIIGGRLLATLDGLRVNSRMQVMNQQGQPIAGLYAAGNCSGGFFWGSYPDHVPGLTASHAVTFGRLAGQAVAD
ncbi:FAD-dependent oxidoreductase [Lacticaseibacillus nasuensis]|uniref:FAD-dependent oxidoreductase n=1 Tax=Lacticaseibacillus nasuensis TaxID=944671 RepID=UPI0022480095|nr:FAD-binding protein [Lacticaseibacillus nasuensis]MCX2455527.1 FAD-binding protein [Lacticaseibacillus nasuensis]